MTRALGLLALAAGACSPDLPRELWIEDDFTAEEAALLEESIAIANRELGEELLGHKVLDYRGPADDPDGFQFHDFDDDRHLVYVLDLASPEYEWLVTNTHDAYTGYATLGDVLVRHMRDLGENREQFRSVALHELGHFLGMTHNPDANAVMYPRAIAIHSGYSVADKIAFCQVHDCRFAPQ